MNFREQGPQRAHAHTLRTLDHATDRFAALHRGGAPLLLPNPWDIGSAKLLASLGFEALATTSSGFAASLGRLDGNVTRDEALSHCAEIVSATALPVNADLENGFAHDPADAAETVRLAAEVGVAGCSIEDFSGDPDDPIYGAGFAVERVAAAVEAAHSGPRPVLLTARAENYMHGRRDLHDTIARLQAFQEAGADVLFAPGLAKIDDIRSVVESVDRPVNVLMWPGVPTVTELSAVGVRRVSVGSALAYAAMGTLTRAGLELLEEGTMSFGDLVATGMRGAHSTFGL